MQCFGTNQAIDDGENKHTFKYPKRGFIIPFDCKIRRQRKVAKPIQFSSKTKRFIYLVYLFFKKGANPPNYRNQETIELEFLLKRRPKQLIYY